MRKMVIVQCSSYWDMQYGIIVVDINGKFSVTQSVYYTKGFSNVVLKFELVGTSLFQNHSN